MVDEHNVSKCNNLETSNLVSLQGWPFPYAVLTALHHFVIELRQMKIRCPVPELSRRHVVVLQMELEALRGSSDGRGALASQQEDLSDCLSSLEYILPATHAAR